MSTATLARMVRAVRHVVAPRHETASDSALLDRWVEQGDQAAFELLLSRHGPMVWDTCRRVLRHEQAAQALGCPRGTVGTRLAWARQRLRDRLQRRGVDLPACLLPLAGVPVPVVESALQGAVAWMGREAVLPTVASLCEEVLRVMW